MIPTGRVLDYPGPRPRRRRQVWEAPAIILCWLIFAAIIGYTAFQLFVHGFFHQEGIQNIP